MMCVCVFGCTTQNTRSKHTHNHIIRPTNQTKTHQPPKTTTGYLAHLAAFRGKLMLDAPDSGSESSRGSGGSRPRSVVSIRDDFSDECMFYV